jgi:hypothetical protein
MQNWERGEFNYNMRTFVNVTRYPQYSKNFKNENKKRTWSLHIQTVKTLRTALCYNLP